MELKDVYQRITDQVIAELEKGVCPWTKPWKAAHLDGRVVLPLRHSAATPARRQDDFNPTGLGSIRTGLG